jgi:hypothetical protein
MLSEVEHEIRNTECRRLQKPYAASDTVRTIWPRRTGRSHPTIRDCNICYGRFTNKVERNCHFPAPCTICTIHRQGRQGFPDMGQVPRNKNNKINIAVLTRKLELTVPPKFISKCSVFSVVLRQRVRIPSRLVDSSKTRVYCSVLQPLSLAAHTDLSKTHDGITHDQVRK